MLLQQEIAGEGQLTIELVNEGLLMTSTG